MKRTRVFFFLSLLFFGFSVSAQKPQLNTSAQRDLRRHIEFLASDKLEGRHTGDAGATAAANYIAEEFKKSRLKPGLRTAYLQPFPYIAGVTLGTGNSLRFDPFSNMEAGVNWMPLGYSPNADIPATDIVFAGFGITAPEANYDDYRDKDVRGKIVLIIDNTPDAGNPHSAFARFDIHTKANIAKDKGAKAIILIAVDPDFKNDRLARLSYDRTLGETAVPVVGIARELGGKILGGAGAEGVGEIEKLLTKVADSKAIAALSTEVTAMAQIKVNVIGAKSVYRFRP